MHSFPSIFFANSKKMVSMEKSYYHDTISMALTHANLCIKIDGTLNDCF